MVHVPWRAALGLVAAMSAGTSTTSKPTPASTSATPESTFDAGVVVPAEPCRGERLPRVVRQIGETRLPARPMWLWDSPKVLLDAAARAELLAFCACQGIDALWMQVALERQRGADGMPVMQHA